MNPSTLLDPRHTGDATPAGRLDADEAQSYEVVHGRRVEIPPMSAYAAKIASRLATRLNLHAEAPQLGEAVVETLFRLPLAEDRGRNRQPDVAFVSYQRWPADRPQPEDANAWDVVPPTWPSRWSARTTWPRRSWTGSWSTFGRTSGSSGSCI